MRSVRWREAGGQGRSLGSALGSEGAEAWTRHSLVGLKRDWRSWLRWPWGWRGCLEQQMASDCGGSAQWTFNLEDKVQGGEERSREGWGCLRMPWGCATCINGSPRRVHTPRRGQLCFTVYCAVLLFPLFLSCISSLPLWWRVYLESHCNSRWNKNSLTCVWIDVLQPSVWALNVLLTGSAVLPEFLLWARDSTQLQADSQTVVAFSGLLTCLLRVP